MRFEAFTTSGLHQSTSGAYSSSLGENIGAVSRLGVEAKANFKFVIATKKEPRGNQTKSYKVAGEANTRGENKEDTSIKTIA